MNLVNEENVNKNKEEVDKFFESESWKNFKKYYETPTVFQLFKNYNREDVITNILEEILKSDNVFQLKTESLIKFYKLLKSKSNEDLPNTFGEIKDIEIMTQYIENGLRPDLIIKFKDDNQKYCIILENKINSGESSENQTLNYLEYFNEKYDPESKKIFAYLSLDNNSKISADAKDSSKKFIRIDYSELIRFLEILSTTADNEVYSILDLIKSLSYIYDDNKIIYTYEKLKDRKMEAPITKEWSRLSEEILKNHKDIIFKEIVPNYEDYKNDILYKLLTVIYYLKCENKDEYNDRKSIEENVLNMQYKSKNGDSICAYKKYIELVSDYYETNIDNIINFKYKTKNKEYKILITSEEYKNCGCKTYYTKRKKFNNMYLLEIYYDSKFIIEQLYEKFPKNEN